MNRLATITAVLAALALPASASAAAVSIKPNAETGGKRVSFVAGPGEINQVNVNLFDNRFVFHEMSVQTLPAEEPCASKETPKVNGSGAGAECPAQGIDMIDIRLGAENDYTFVGAMSHPNVPALIAGGPGNDDMTGTRLGDRIFGEGGADRIAGREGSDVLVGGAGDDQIEAEDGSIDRIWCGLGFDSVAADANDVIAKDCDVVNGEQRALGEVTDEPEVPPLDDTDPEIPTILLDIEIDPLAEVLRDGLVVTVGCSATCTISPQLRVSDKLMRRFGLPTTLVARSPAVTTRRGKRVRLRFSTRVRRILRKQQAIPFVLRADARDVDGNPFAVETKLRLRAAPEPGR